jgi:hypothetical protein
VVSGIHSIRCISLWALEPSTLVFPCRRVNDVFCCGFEGMISHAGSGLGLLFSLF